MSIPKKGRRKLHRADDDYFSDANERWYLEKLYADLAGVGWVLTPMQKKCLRGVLLARPLEEIDKELHVSVNRAKVVLSESVYKAVRALTGEKTVNLKTLPRVLFEWGYAKKIKKPSPDENPYLSVAITVLQGDKKVILHLNGRHKENFAEKIEALTKAADELIRDGRFTLVHDLEFPLNPASLNDQELSLLKRESTPQGNNFSGPPYPSTQDSESARLQNEGLLEIMVEREVTWFFQALFNIADSDLKNRSLSALTQDLVAPYSLEDRDSVIRAFFSSARVLICVKDWEKIEHKAKAEIERILTPLLHRTSKVIFLARPVSSLSFLVTPSLHTLHYMYPDFYIPDFDSMRYFSTEMPELVEEFYGQDDLETALYGE